jgi:hypothetical protein
MSRLNGDEASKINLILSPNNYIGNIKSFGRLLIKKIIFHGLNRQGPSHTQKIKHFPKF